MNTTGTPSAAALAAILIKSSVFWASAARLRRRRHGPKNRLSIPRRYPPSPRAEAAPRRSVRQDPRIVGARPHHVHSNNSVGHLSGCHIPADETRPRGDSTIRPANGEVFERIREAVEAPRMREITVDAWRGSPTALVERPTPPSLPAAASRLPREREPGSCTDPRGPPSTTSETAAKVLFDTR